MKTIKEKAEAYDKALEIASNIYKDANEAQRYVLDILFPELSGPDDEEIKKALIDFFSKGAENGEQTNGIYDKDILAWLEKQGDKPFDYENANIQQKDFAPKSAMEAIKEEKVDNANKVEPKDYSSIDPYFGKPIDKVEPKFKIGDWIVNNGSNCICQIKSIRDNEYCLCPLDSDVEGFLEIADIDNNHHLWTIADAKGGDVLCTGNGNLFIFKERKDDVIYDYCGFYNNVFYPWSGSPNGTMVHSSYNDYKSASKEQHDLLFSKMKEVGYKLDKDFNVIKI